MFAESKGRFGRYIGGEKEAIHPDLREAVFGTVLRKGGQEEFDALIKLYKSESAADQKVIILRALGSAPTQGVMEAAMEFAMSSEVRDQDTYITIGYLAANTAGRQFVFAWFQTNFATLHARFYKGSFIFGRMIGSVCSHFATVGKADAIQKLFDECGLELTAVSRSIEQAVESVRANARWLGSCKEGVTVWLREN